MKLVGGFWEISLLIKLVLLGLRMAILSEFVVKRGTPSTHLIILFTKKDKEALISKLIAFGSSEE